MLSTMDLAPASRPRSNNWMPLVGISVVASLASIFLLYGLTGHEFGLLLLLGVPGAVLGIGFGALYTSRHENWLILPLNLVFLLIQIASLGDTTRGLLHYAALALFCVPVLPKVWRSRIFHTGGFRLYSLYFLWAGITVFYSLAPEYSIARLVQSILLLFAVTACALTVENADGARRLILGFLAACGLVIVALALAAIAMPHSLAWLSPEDSFTPDVLADMARKGISVDGIERFRGFFDNPNQIGVLMIVAVGSALVCWTRSSSRRRLILALIVLASTALAFLADSRSPFIAVAIGIALYAVWKWGARVGLVLTAGIAAVIFAISSVDPGVLDYMNRDVGSLTGRTEMWAFAIQRLMEHPISGYGYEAGAVLFLRPDFPVWWGPWDLGPHSSLHDGYLNHALGTGIPATLLWLFIVLRPWIFLFRQPADPWNLKPCFFLIVIPILIYNITEALLVDFAGNAALLFGLVWAIGERYRLFALERAGAERREASAKLPRAVAAAIGINEPATNFS
jgi:O-antigen ligase/polysaccharide polymerase Wzy-like membrane protein